MGQKVSHEKANVIVSLREGMSRPDTLKVSYKGGGCLRRRRPIAFLTFPSTGWRCAEGIEACEAEGGLSVPLAALKHKDGSKIIQLRCGSGRRTLLKAAMPLGKFLNNLDYLHFSLHCDGRGSSGAYTGMRCNGHPCVEAAPPPMWHRPNGGKEASDPTKASVTPAGGAGGITKAANTRAGDATHITKAANTRAGDVTHITKAANTRAGDVTHITKAANTKAGDVTHITKAANTRAGDVTHITKAANTPGSPPHTLRRRKTKKPNLRAHGRATATPKRHGAPYTWTDAFLDVTAICAVVMSGVLAYYTRW
ncbi:uncharacterized protein LOC127005441 isoform X30 [Eriocheir sinensis]|uniref:uncharacterized protein LOC127005441 isoform X30 n=1 Tax=Eriocheir sinensis TaxID=95602 RepID=UPI0021CA542B|nr:uncharacterized protein LOC127005441 isoform X30 [Eriocheir sinensis]